MASSCSSQRQGFRLSPLVAAFVAAGLASPVAWSAPEGGVVRAGQASIQSSGNLTRIVQGSDRAVIDWRTFGTMVGETVRFEQPSSTSATLNRVTGPQNSVLMGRLDANGQVFLINPHGIIIGKDAQINVAGFVASTANIANEDFMAKRLAFTQPGQPDAAVVNAGTITAAEGGLVALVAPQVRNDGVIVARLGRVALGAGDTFTLDLYGDQLIQLAMRDNQVGQLVDARGQPVVPHIAQAGTIDAAGGKVVLVTSATGKQVLDEVINLSGVIRADTVNQQAGEVLLLGRDGNLNLSGTISANGGESGNGGKVVVWADGNTNFTGNILARGGDAGGNGGFVEVSGKQTVAFLGNVDASAPNGLGGLLLVDPAFLVIDATQAVQINQTLRSGTNASLQADDYINVDAMIDGRGGTAGGGLTLTAGNNINLNNYIVTNNAPITLTATAGTVTHAANTGLFAGNGAISVTTGSNYTTGVYSTTGFLALRSTGGTLTLGNPIYETTGNTSLRGDTGVDINADITNIRNGADLTVVTDSGDININARIDAQSSGTLASMPGGSVTLTAANDVSINETITTNNGAVNVIATNGTVSFYDSVGDGTGNKKIISGSGDITITTGGNLSTGTIMPTSRTLATYGDGTKYLCGENFVAGCITNEAIYQAFADQLKPWVTLSTIGKITLTSTGGNVSIDAPIPSTTGEIAINATNGGVTVNEQLLTNSGNIAIAAGTGGITVNTASSDNFTMPISHLSAGNPTTTIFQSENLPTNFGQNYLRFITTTVDARNADLTLTSIGDIAINGSIASKGDIAISATGLLARILGPGGIGKSSYLDSGPSNVTLSASEIGNNFDAGFSSVSTTATIPGNISMSGGSSGTLAITSQNGGISAGSLGGLNTTINAHSNLAVGDLYGGTLNLFAGGAMSLHLVQATSLTATAAGNVTFNDVPSIQANDATVWLNGGGLNVTSTGGSILFQGNAGISIITSDPFNPPYPSMTLSAATGSVELRRLQTYGDVSITAGGNITLHNDIGPMFNSNPSVNNPYFVFNNRNGVNALTLSASGTITKQGVRAENQILINGVVTPSTAVGWMVEMASPFSVGAEISPGPTVSQPALPAAISAQAPGAPAMASLSPETLPEIPVSETSPQVADQFASLTSQFDGANIFSAINETPPASDTPPPNTNGADGNLNPLAFDTATGTFLVFAGGRGDGLEEERRR